MTIVDHERAIVSSLDALSRGDIGAHLANCTEDVVVEFPYARAPVRIEGRDELGRYLERALGVFSLELKVARILITSDPDVVVAEYESTGRVTTTDKPYANAYITIFEFDGPLIARQREYYNPIPAVEALS
jgi:ketosteroid isomerase-like protein